MCVCVCVCVHARARARLCVFRNRIFLSFHILTLTSYLTSDLKNVYLIILQKNDRDSLNFLFWGLGRQF